MQVTGWMHCQRSNYLGEIVIAAVAFGWLRLFYALYKKAVMRLFKCFENTALCCHELRGYRARHQAATISSLNAARQS